MKTPTEILQGDPDRPYSQHVRDFIDESFYAHLNETTEGKMFRYEIEVLYHEAQIALLKGDVDDPDYGIVADLVDRIENYLYPSLVSGKINRLLRECEETFLSALVIVEDALDNPVTKHQARKSSNQIRKVLGKLHEWEQTHQS